jgi:hypothetical protein
MSYDYSTEKSYTLTDEGQRRCFEILRTATKALAIAGCVRAQELMGGHSGDSFRIMACIDRLVEAGELREVPTEGAWQHRVFVAGHD